MLKIHWAHLLLFGEFLNSKFKMLQVQQGPLKRWLLHSREYKSCILSARVGQVIRVFPSTLNKITYINACLPQMSEKHQVCHLVLIWEDCLQYKAHSDTERERRYQWNSRKIKRVCMDKFFVAIEILNGVKSSVPALIHQTVSYSFLCKPLKWCNKISPELACHINI